MTIGTSPSTIVDNTNSLHTQDIQFEPYIHMIKRIDNSNVNLQINNDTGYVSNNIIFIPLHLRSNKHTDTNIQMNQQKDGHTHNKHIIYMK